MQTENIMPNTMPFMLYLVLLNFTFTSAASDHAHQSLPHCLNQYIPSHNASTILFSNTDPSYTSILRAYIRNARFNTSSTPKPAIIITPLDESHVSAYVICSQKLGFHLKIRSGGHDYEGLSYVFDKPFFVLDMFNIRSIFVNITDESAWVQAGATLGELYYNIWKKSNVHGFPAGVCPTVGVGVGGTASSAGYGNLLRKYGLSVDHIVDAKIVDVIGRVLDRKGMGEDLFWAIRGGGAASFGVVLAYKMKLVRVPKTVTIFRVDRLLSENATDIALKWQSVAPTTDKNLFMRMLLQPVTINKQTTLKVTIRALYLGDANSVVALLRKEFPELGLTKEKWIDSVLWWANFDMGTLPTVLLDRKVDKADFLKRKSDYVQTIIPRHVLELLWKKIIELGNVGMACNPSGGRMNEIESTEIPFPHRGGNLYKIQYVVNWDKPGNEADIDYTSRMRRLHSFMTQFVSKNRMRRLHGFITQFVSKNPRRAYLKYRDIEIGTTKNWSYEEGKVYEKGYFKVNQFIYNYNNMT